MPLIINDLVYDENKFNHFYDTYSTLKETSSRFQSKPIRLINSPEKFLFVSQGEYCIVNRTDDDIDVVGSDEATTCLIAFLQTDTSIAVAHIDSALTLNSLKQMINELLNDGKECKNRLDERDASSKIICRLVGSYSDEQKHSSRFLYKLFIFLKNIPNVTIELKLACLLDMNTKIIHKNDKQYNSPIFYGAAIELRKAALISLKSLASVTLRSKDSRVDCELFPAEFKDRSPDIVLRRARRTCQSKDIVQVYNSNSRIFIIDEFKYFRINNLEQLANATDQFILDNFSTSPYVEPPHFAQSMRQMFALMKSHKTQESAHRFRRENNEWREIL